MFAKMDKEKVVEREAAETPKKGGGPTVFLSPKNGIAYNIRILPPAKNIDDPDAGLSAGLLAQTVGWTILLSVVLHGISAVPLADWYARRLEAADPASPELVEVPELGVRRWDPLAWLKHHRPGAEEAPR